MKTIHPIVVRKETKWTHLTCTKRFLTCHQRFPCLLDDYDHTNLMLYLFIKKTICFTNGIVSNFKIDWFRYFKCSLLNNIKRSIDETLCTFLMCFSVFSSDVFKELSSI